MAAKPIERYVSHTEPEALIPNRIERQSQGPIFPVRFVITPWLRDLLNRPESPEAKALRLEIGKQLKLKTQCELKSAMGLK